MTSVQGFLGKLGPKRGGGRKVSIWKSVHFSAQRVGLPVPNAQFPDNSCIYMYVHCNLIFSSIQTSAVCRALGKNILNFFLFY